MSELKLEVGKSYVNRKGGIVKIVSNYEEHDNYTHKGDDYQLYTTCGNYYEDGEFTDYDLIEEYIEPSISENNPKKNISYTVDNTTMYITRKGNKTKLKFGSGYSFPDETAAVLTDTENGYICKFKSCSSVTQDYYVCLDYSQAQDLYLLLKTVLGDTITEGENNE